MSTEAPAGVFPGLSEQARKQALLRRAVIRFALGVTGAMVLAQTIEWPLSFVSPVFVAMLLGPPGIGLPLKAYIGLFFGTLVAFALGLALVIIALPYPMVFFPLLALMLFITFFKGDRGLNMLMVLMLLIALLMFPSIGLLSRSLAVDFAFGFLVTLAISFAICLVCYAWLPSQPMPKPAPPKLPPVQDSLDNAWLCTLLVLPLAGYFYWFDRTDALLVLVLVAVLSLDLRQAAKAGVGLILANLFGGIAATAFYQLLVAVPELEFFAPLMALTTLLFGWQMFTSPKGKLFGSGFTALLILVGSTIGSSGGDAEAKFATRIAQMVAATGYLVLGSWLLMKLGWLTPREDPSP